MTSPETSVRHIFVYGTLRRGEVRDINRLLPAPQWIAEAWVQGLLYDLGSYPGLVLGEGGRVHGEVYAISTALERTLDEIEEVWPQKSGEYVKREVLVQPELANHLEAVLTPPLQCLSYELSPEYSCGKPLIVCGDWPAYRKIRLAGLIS